ncbi:MAG: glycosyl hydrolase family protein [Chloroflexi bacterium]|nr:MAG: glycosyl hydrolase family protein [Chloroflexota bacterium]
MRRKSMTRHRKQNKKYWIAGIITLILLLGIISAAGAPAYARLGATDRLADFEGGLPAGWFTFFGGSTVTTATQTVTDTDPLARPGQVGSNEILAVDFNISDFGGFGQAYADTVGPQDWSNYESVDFWFYGTGSGLTYQIEISDNRSNPNADTSERFDYEFTDSTPGWQYISVPFTDFTRATDFQPGGAPDDGLTLTEVWAWAIVLPQGVDTVYFDDVSLGRRVIDDFESGLPSGTDEGVLIGFFTFQGAGSSVGISTTASPPSPVPPAAGQPNTVLQVDVDSTSFAGFIHGFENDTLDTWVSQNWVRYAGFSFWIYGNNSGTSLFIDLLENRNPGSTTDDAERWTVTFVDDFSGWKKFEFPFSSFSRKEIGNGAPNDGLTLDQVHGWAFGTLGTGGPLTFYIDNVTLYGVGELPPLQVSYAFNINNIDEGSTGSISVKLNRPFTDNDPAQVSVDFATESAASTAVAGRDYTPTSGTLTFVNGGPTEQSFPLETLDNNKYEGNKRVVLRLSNPVDVELGFITQASAIIVDNDPFDRDLIDDFERGAFFWHTTGNLALQTPEIAAGDALAVPEQGAYEHILAVDTPRLVDIVVSGSLCNNGNGVVPVVILTTDKFDATTVDHNSVRFGLAAEAHTDKKTGVAKRHEGDFEGDGDTDLIFHFRVKDTGYDCDSTSLTLTGTTFAGEPVIAGGTASFGRDFAIGQDWSRGEALRFWFYGTNSGDAITVQLKDNRAPDPGPSGWNLAWSDEFNEPAGTPPNPAHWSYEIGDVTPDGKNGWGNEELQYYTDDPANAATDGNGNLALTLRQADGSLQCYYGPCEYTSARLISWHKAEFAYGRIEARIKVPQGTGIWPAFWSLGNDIDRNPWPGTGEIDFMEFVGRLPNEIFGTIHGPGYSGGQSFGGIYQFGEPVYNDFHTFAIEWEPDLIKWYVDGILYHTATPADVAPNPWVFNDPVFLLLNVAVGGNFGGPVGNDLNPPQSMLVDYIRVYQAPDTAERWEASFADNFSGWQEVVIPFDSFIRSADQPAGAPDDGLNLSDVWGYGFSLPEGGTTSGALRLDQVRLQLAPPPTQITVTNLNDSGSGSLRQALEDIAIGGTITFDPALAGGTITLTTGPLVPGRNVTIDGSDAPGLTLNGGGNDRVLIVDAGLTVALQYLTITNGFGWQLAGGVLNNGNLTLDHVTVTGNTTATDAGSFWQGGAGIYNGEGSTLNLVDSTVSNNTSGWAGGGVFSFFNTSTHVERSVISGNLANDVGGGLRLLGNATIVNSTISGNQSTGWYGGALFLTDGVLDMTHTTVADNVSPSFAPASVFVGTFGVSSATLNLANSIIANNVTDGCFLAPFGSGPVSINSLGGNTFTDGTCFPVAGDQVVSNAGLAPLADNGGPTQTHALTPGSPAIDSAGAAACPATDQRGVSRPQGAGCDAGAFELVP